ncbi:hypothetical protein CONPUDRAFT_148225 [Coniophora puteana RWD-64-598 SS2]|uniref:Uncharacterized protein n=1 Tax=Coniophora puteana (strain RWD-64-598) TaxID=741705 RepID=A0A5M3N492_CONPW|nr:uncharacterized protein CONPUDRAFT_148225 [Coniophora puteana RWD-64-598 SS2]EIW86116.1 hypothetical protein CONPUDRAFT_148225 [Coniophora puteana RWD-64-598 SS2]
MHHALQIEEIVENILWFAGPRESSTSFRPPSWDDKGHPFKSLAVLARTCAALSELALDALWAHIDSIEPLLLSLPDALIEVQESGPIWHKSFAKAAVQSQRLENFLQVLQPHAQSALEAHHAQPTYF